MSSNKGVTQIVPNPSQPKVKAADPSRLNQSPAQPSSVNPTEIRMSNQSSSNSRSHRPASRNKSYQKQSSFASHRSQHQDKSSVTGKIKQKADSSASNEPDGSIGVKPISCLTLDEFSKHARDIKTDILQTIEKQNKKKESETAPNHEEQIARLKQDIETITRLHGGNVTSDETDREKQNTSATNMTNDEGTHADHESSEAINKSTTSTTPSDSQTNAQSEAPNVTTNRQPQTSISADVTSDSTKSIQVDSKDGQTDNAETDQTRQLSISSNNESQNSSPLETKSLPLANVTGQENDAISQSMNQLSIDSGKSVPLDVDPSATTASTQSSKAKQLANVIQGSRDSKAISKEIDESKTNNNAVTLRKDNNNSKNAQNNNLIFDDAFSRRLDTDTKVSALLASFQGKVDDPRALEPICKRLVSLSEQISQLMGTCSKLKTDNQRLTAVKQKLEEICRELQKSNTAIRIENLNLIKGEQSRSREMTTKFQSTLNDLIRLFEENQQRNLALRQENHDLQARLKSLVEHCENWEKSVDTTLRQREIENRLIKTELAKANLLKNEEKEKFLSEKQELLQLLSLMQEQQQRIEGQEAKLRLDLSSYASKYDECQAVISKGMNKFQTESKKMLKQIERSKQDYKILLTKYTNTNEKMAQLLEEKQRWNGEMSAANRKIETLEKLCRALQSRKPTIDQAVGSEVE